MRHIFREVNEITPRNEMVKCIKQHKIVQYCKINK